MVKREKNNIKQEYALKNREWLKEKGKEEGVMPLPGGMYYRILETGDPNGKMPSAGSVVTVNYVGRTVDGREFDSSRGGVAPAFRLRELIPGWITALQCMHPGDKWEIYLPADQAYGKYSQPGIPANSTLIFEIHLLSVS